MGFIAGLFKAIIYLGVVVVVVVVGGAVFMVTVGCQTPALAKEMRIVASSGPLAPVFDAKMKSLETKQAREVQVSEQEVSSKANAMGTPFKEISINFVGAGARSRASAKWEYQGVSCPMAVEADARVANGQFQVNILRLQLGMVGVPDFVLEQLRSAILQQIARVNIPPWLGEARITGDGAATVTGK
jgi:hypothetical protein